MPKIKVPTSDNPFDATRLLELDNIADRLDDETLKTIGTKVVQGYQIDERSRKGWLDMYEEWLSLAMQVVEKKMKPWPGAANVKYPLLTQAAISYNARIAPALFSGPKIVKGRVVGQDPTGEKQKSAIRVETHMDYQVKEQMTEWEEDTDRLTLTQSIVGNAYKKTYYVPGERRNKSELVLPHDLCVHYYAASLESARRITQILSLSKNDIHERMMDEVYLDVELGKTNVESEARSRRRKILEQQNQTTAPAGDEDRDIPREILEQHTWWDLDDDGYEEPYIITVDLQTSQVLRMTARFEADGIRRNGNGEIVRIEPVHYFTKYGFIPSPDGSFYDIGFGTLLGSINNSLNTVINQLIDAGTLSNMQSGFLARGIRVKGGALRFKPGMWAIANTSAAKLKDGIVPLPVREPSQVLMALLTFLLTSGEKLGSIVDSLTGENPGQNQKATTTMAVLEQGLKVFSAVQRRQHRSLNQELKKLHRLNAIYLDEREYYGIVDEPGAEQQHVFQLDYQGDWTDVIPASDASVTSQAQRLMKVQGLMEAMAGGIELNREEVRKRLLEAMEQPGIEALTQPNPPSPPPVEVRKQDLDEKKFKHAVEKDFEDERRKDSESKAKIALQEAQSLLTEMQAANAAGEQYHAQIGNLLRTINMLNQAAAQEAQAREARANDTGSESTTESA